METAPVGCISGHIHQQGFTAIETASGYTSTFNPGAPGIASVAVSRSEIFQAEELAVE